MIYNDNISTRLRYGEEVLKKEETAMVSDKKKFNYVYRVTSKTTEQFYIGSRASKHVPEDDLWVKYFTSSKLIKQQLSEDGAESFSAEVLAVFDEHDDAYWYEQRLIKENIGNRKCLNRHFIDPDSGKKKFNMSGTSRPLTPEQKKAVGDFHRGLKRGPQSEDHRRKISEAQLGKPRKKLTEEHKQRIREWCNTRWSDPDARKKQAEVMANVNRNRAKGNNESH